MKMTIALKGWLVENKRAAAGATDEELTKAAATSLVEGVLTAEKLLELTTGGNAGVASELKTFMNDVSARLAAIEARPAATAAASEKPDASVFEKLFAGAGGDGAQLDPKETVVRVKGAHESYEKTRKAAVYPEFTKEGKGRHPFAGQPVRDEARELEHSSDLDKAISGAFFKFMLKAQHKGPLPPTAKMTDHEVDLIQYALRECKWGGVIRAGFGDDAGEEAPNAIAVKNRKLSDMEIKAVLDDVTSGGIEIAPIVFDDDIIMTPLLHSELYPLVTVKTITRGRRIEGASMGNVTLSSGGVDGTDIPLFNTASFVAAFDTNIHVVNGAIEIGLDFLSDSPIGVAEEVTRQYGEVLLAWLDEQIALGDGSTEPEGIFVASGTVSVAMGSDAPTVGDYENLLFGVPKQYKRGTEPSRIVYLGNETSYSRARAIAVGGSDQRRVFGMDHESYKLLGHDYKIEDSLPNTKVAFFNARRYRMYRRLGLTMKTTTEGKTLTRANQMLITARARFGGNLEDGNCAAVCTDAQA